MYDLVVIGGGPAGLTASLAASAGHTVAMVERNLTGGTCVDFGCTPSKSLLRAARAVFHALEGEKFGYMLNDAPRVDFAAVMIWAVASNVISSLFVADVNSFELAVSSVVIATFGLAVVNSFRIKPEAKAMSRQQFILGLLFAGLTGVNYLALARLPVAVAILLLFTSPIMVVLWTALTTGAYAFTISTCSNAFIDCWSCAGVEGIGE